jgi:hypothetical protein
MLLPDSRVSISILGGENQALKDWKIIFGKQKIKVTNWPVMV